MCVILQKKLFDSDACERWIGFVCELLQETIFMVQIVCDDLTVQ